MRVIQFTDEMHNAYEDFVRHHPGAMIYYSLRFKYFLEKMTGAESRYLIAIDKKNNIHGVLPLMVKSGPYGKVINSLPFYGSNGGILSQNSNAKDALLHHYKELITSGEFAAATLIDNPLDREYDYSGLNTNETDSRIGQLTRIAGDYANLEGIMTLFNTKTRNVIRKAIKSNVEVLVENNMFDFLQVTHVDNLQSIGGLAKDDLFFKLVPQCFEAGIDYNLYVARHQGVPIAATLVFYYAEVVEYYTPVIVKEYRSIQPLSLVIATCMLEASQKGFKWWNWGGTWQSQGGVYDFKSKWGTIDVNYFYHIAINNKELYISNTSDLLKYYPMFYVLPFNKLATS